MKFLQSANIGVKLVFLANQATNWILTIQTFGPFVTISFVKYLVSKCKKQQEENEVEIQDNDQNIEVPNILDNLP